MKKPFWKRYVDSFKPMEPVIEPYTDGTGNMDEPVQAEVGLKRTLKNRHMQMIAFVSALSCTESLYNVEIF